MQKLIGLFVHPFMHRRECMCIFHHIYAFVDKMPEATLTRLPQHVRDELLTASLLLPLASQSRCRQPMQVPRGVGGLLACLQKAM